ncbi:sodium:solute symporter [Embleya sp. NBC_00896]|uniref:sodium:solute symporter family protein n=1 Tax=Embleya sp. NBC_00896 TaxID=2975961 RepID=UPI003865BDAE|nr:sodium:solute symporter family protein [Embleya sp. NBC_00896]
MTVTFAVALVGMLLIAALGFLGRRGKSNDLTEWTVGERNFGALTTWFLQAGEAFTTFTFLGVAGIAFGGGVAATYAIPYIPLSYIGTFFIAPILWRLARDRDYITQADYFEDRYKSKTMGFVVAVMGVVFLLPYLQLQITGLGAIVSLVTGKENAGDTSMIVATVLTVAFVLWSGIRGVAKTAYLKDFLMILAMIVLIVAIPAHYAGGVGDVFDKIGAARPELLTVHSDGPNDKIWWVTSIVVSALGSAFMTLPHLWPATLSARNEDVLRKNAIWLPLYQIVIILPIVIGFTGALALDKKTPGRRARRPAAADLQRSDPTRAGLPGGAHRAQAARHLAGPARDDLGRVRGLVRDLRKAGRTQRQRRDLRPRGEPGRRRDRAGGVPDGPTRDRRAARRRRPRAGPGPGRGAGGVTDAPAAAAPTPAAGASATGRGCGVRRGRRSGHGRTRASNRC